MKINILTLFQKMFESFVSESIISRAIKFGAVEVNLIDIRDYCFDKHKQDDDLPFGGGNGMVMKPEPLFLALENLSGKVIYTSPQGKTFNQEIAKELAKKEELTIIAGHYEGIDERVLEIFANEVFSIGDFILTGGELPALVMCDAILRNVNGVLGNRESLEEECFNNNLLDAPSFSKPFIFEKKNKKFYLQFLLKINFFFFFFSTTFWGFVLSCSFLHLYLSHKQNYNK